MVEKQLSTGLKVSAAIDNPSSYYTSLSLNNQANELSALLDSMALSVKNLKNTMAAIDSGIEFLELAKSAAQQALENFTSGVDKPDEPDPPEEPIPPGAQKLDKAGLSQILNYNGIFAVVVDSKEQLMNALNNAGAGDNIVVWGDVNLANEVLHIGAGVNLISAQTVLNQNNLNDQYYVDDANKGKLTINIDTALADNGRSSIYVSDNAKIADIVINYDSNVKADIITNNSGKGVVLENLTINATNRGSLNSIYSMVNNNGNGGEIIMRGDNSFNFDGNRVGMYAVRGAYNAVFTLEEGATFNMEGVGGFNGGYNYINGTINSRNSMTFAASAGKFEISGVVNVEFLLSSVNNVFSATNLTLKSGSEFNVFDPSDHKLPFIVNEKGEKNFITEAGARFSYTGSSQYVSLVSKGFTQSVMQVDIDTMLNDTANWDVDSGTPALMMLALPVEGRAGGEGSAGNSEYQTILKQFDAMIKDASYNGVNLLQSGNLRIKFNNEGSAFLDIRGVDASSQSLGISNISWDSAENVSRSINELDGAISSLRAMSGDFANYYSVVTTREIFSESLINILSEGADKLTLADMNEASAQMLSLQTAGQLAAGALSMSSVSASAILKLF